MRDPGARQQAAFEPRLEPGRPAPLGATLEAEGVNFALFSEHAGDVTLVLFAPGEERPTMEWSLAAPEHRSGAIWHAFARGVAAGWHYAYRAELEPNPEPRRFAFDRSQLLLDPYARGVGGAERWGEGAARRPRRGRIVARSSPSQADSRPHHHLAETVIYELHVRGFTRHPSSGVRHPGTYRGLVEKIPYLTELGITAVQLLPIAEFEENDNPRREPSSGRPLKNLWGYQPLSFFAPKAGYAQSGETGSEVTELREAIEALHDAGIEVFLDVVFNHTGEGEVDGWTVSWRGIDNPVYYLLEGESGLPRDLTGCGNTLRTGHSVVRRLILDCLRYWVSELGIDGFRFDLASVLTRGADGEPLTEPPLLAEIASDPLLATTKLIAEPWDCAGLNQVGSFPGYGRFAEWNGRFRNAVRRFVRGDAGTATELALRLAGSPDLYAAAGRPSQHGVNFVTCHDGFTLADLVSYERKHNRVNGEGNRDGTEENLSWNCGVEGPTDDDTILRLRLRQAKNCAALLLLSRGVPMLLAGDEMGRSQLGNNNAYCQDNDISWIDWTLLDRHRELHRFYCELLRLRRRCPILRRSSFEDEPPSVARTGTPDDGSAPFLALYYRATLGVERPAGSLFLVCNATPRAEPSSIPELPRGFLWHRALDTALPSPQDVAPAGGQRPLESPALLRVAEHSVVLLVALADR